MTLGISLALTLGAGLHRDAGPARLRARCQLAWGGTEVFVAHRTAYDLTRVKAWRHTAGWAIAFAVAHRTPYGLRLDGVIRLPYEDMRRHHLKHVQPYTDLHPLRAALATPYSDLESHRRAMRFPYWLTARAVARTDVAYAVNATDPVASRLAASWSLLADQRLQAVANTPELVWHDRTLRIERATLSCDEDSPVWIAAIELANLGDFAAIAIGDRITLALGAEVFALVVDGKSLSRESPTDTRCELTAVSPAALLDAPFAPVGRYHEPAAVPARSAVEHLVGPVDWQLGDWIIPPGRLLLEGVTPLQGARHIVAAIGGLIESAPGGRINCRRRHPVRVPDYYDGAAPAHSLFDSDVLATRAQIAPQRGFNRVTVANEEPSKVAVSDRIEFVPAPDDRHRGRVRAYPAPRRPVRLVHTGHPQTVIGALGEVTRTESERVEFVDGRAGTRYPVASLLNTVWQHADLGEVTVAARTLTAGVPGYSLLELRYTTTALEWEVALGADEEVQFVLTDA